MKRATGAVVLGLSACGYPLTQLVIRRWGVRGAAITESACASLVIRDASMVAGGVTGRLRRVPAMLLRLELAAGIVASLAGLVPLLRDPDVSVSPASGLPGTSDHQGVTGEGTFSPVASAARTIRSWPS